MIWVVRPGWACGLLSELSKSPHRSVHWLCVCQPTCPALPLPLPLPPSLPSIHPSSYPCPSPHWSPMPRLLPTDHSAWCLLCLGEVNKLSGQSKWGPQGPEEPLNATEGENRRKTKDGRHETDGREENGWGLEETKGMFFAGFSLDCGTKKLLHAPASICRFQKMGLLEKTLLQTLQVSSERRSWRNCWCSSQTTGLTDKTCIAHTKKVWSWKVVTQLKKDKENKN